MFGVFVTTPEVVDWVYNKMEEGRVYNLLDIFRVIRPHACPPPSRTILNRMGPTLLQLLGDPKVWYCQHTRRRKRGYRVGRVRVTKGRPLINNR